MFNKLGITIFHYVMFLGWVLKVNALVNLLVMSLSLPGRGVHVGLHCYFAFCTDSSVAVSVLMAFSSLLGFLSCGERSTEFSLQD